jgi:5'(3')-deoxyribonucleotidase
MVKPRLMLDVDGVLADFATPALAFLASINKYKTYDQIHSWDIFEGNQEVENLFKETYASKPGFCYGLKPLPGAVEFIRAARENYDIAIVTTPYDVPHWCNERQSWLTDILGLSRSTITFTHHKQFVSGDIFIEDKAENIAKWHDFWPNQLAVIMDKPWNRVELSDKILRVNGFEDVALKLSQLGLPQIY